MGTAQRLVVVTGGSQGIGLAISQHLLKRNYRVIIGDLRVDEALLGATAHWPLDVGNSGSVDAFFARLQEEHGPLDALVCNAGIFRHGPTETMSNEAWQSVLDTNLTGGFYCARAAARCFATDGCAAVVFIASMNGQMGWPGRANYASSKAGLIGLTRSLAVEWAARGVRVNAVAPGYVETSMLLDRIKNGTLDPADLLARIPLGRFARAEDIVGAVEFMLSSHAAYITGQTLNVDGGWTIYGGK